MVEHAETSGDDQASWIWSRGWLATRQEHALRLSAGQDEHYLIDGLRPAVVTDVLGWADGQPVTAPTDATDHEWAELFDFLVTQGAVTPKHRVAHSISVRQIGDSVPLNQLVTAIESHPRLHPAPSATLQLLLWSTGRPADLLEHGDLDGPVLLVDVSNHHTLALGPYVLRPYTSCILCLAGRLLHRWGDRGAAPEPEILADPPLVAGLIAIAVDLIDAGTSPLVNGVATWDLHTGVSSVETLLKSPSCPRCARLRSGPIDLAP